MGIFGPESKDDAFLQEEDLRTAQRDLDGRKQAFGAWAIMRSSLSAEQREERAIQRKQKSLERKQQRLERIQKVRRFASQMVLWSR